MSKILVAYIFSLLGYDVWNFPRPAPVDDAHSLVAVEAKADDAAPRADARKAPAAGPTANSQQPTAVSPLPVSAKTDAGTTAPSPAPAPTPAPAPAADAGTPPPAGPTANSQEPTADASAADGDVLTAEQIIVRVQGVYDGTTTFQANFRQVFRHRLNPERSKEATGVVYLQKPGKMRWEYHDPERKLIVSDGTTLWAYEPSEDQVFEQSLSETDLPTAVSFLLGGGSLSAEFDARLIDDSGESADRYVLELRPKVASSHYSRLLLVVNRADFQVVRTVVVDHSGNTNSVEFAGVVLNGDIPASQFRFVRPEGARVIR
jgi:outer membrane lipoprotein carrier protein